MRLIQSLALWAYKAAVDMGLMSTGWGRSLFDCAYLTYKRRLEAGDIDRLRSFVTEGSTVIDVGANIGFFTLTFAQWVGPNGRVLAIEPEQTNFDRLVEMLRSKGVSGRVDARRAAVIEHGGTCRLALNLYHPGDHRVAEDGIEVPALCLDEWAKEGGSPRVSLIKIDVQGAEERVLAGALRLMERDRPALFVELDDQALSKSGSSIEQVCRRLIDAGYDLHDIKGGAVTRLEGVQAATALARERGYTDILALATTQQPTA